MEDIRLSITRDMLKKINSVLPLVCNNRYEVRLFAVAFSLVFHVFSEWVNLQQILVVIQIKLPVNFASALGMLLLKQV